MPVLEASPDVFALPKGVRGWLTAAEGQALAELARRRLVLEIGSWCGLSTICLARTATHVHAVDWFRGDDGAGWENTLLELTDNLLQHGVRDKVTIHVGQAEELAGIVRPVFDLAFIDGAHDEESVRGDLDAALALLKPGAVIAMHDWPEVGVRKAAAALLGWGPADGLCVNRLRIGKR